MSGLSPSVEQFRRIASLPDEVIRLAEAALLVAAEEYRDLDVAHYLRIIDDLGASLKRRLRRDISPAEAIIALNHFLFEEHGFRGNTADYYDPRNSFLNEVLERRLGIPITLSILYIEVGRYIGLPLHGVSFPAHFLVKCTVRDGAIVLDPYARGRSLSTVELRQRVTQLHAGRAPSPSALVAMLAAASNREILARMLRNLKGVYVRRRELTKALAAAERVLFVMPGLAAEYRDRGTIYLGLECFRAALEDFRRYLALAPHAEDAERIRECVAELELRAARLN
ncbi:MAG: tetratricopeptide repeat protein [Betaproteobacteria bacterium]|nr:tetratricopeptide repeat protein [Betaproteobacteria bacterium]